MQFLLTKKPAFYYDNANIRKKVETTKIEAIILSFKGTCALNLVGFCANPSLIDPTCHFFKSPDSQPRHRHRIFFDGVFRLGIDLFASDAE